ncbi:hypothetical protein Ptr902_09131 [Pyrenophora tritici-repentis]|nr:hypothetical protein Ptr902_09131 [Pyrenophora tritici-repentis]
MPHYEIHNSYRVPTYNKRKLAADLTSLHTRLFGTPKGFVTVTFHRTTDWRMNLQIRARETFSNTQFISVGGQKAWTNTIICHATAGAEYNRAKLRQLVIGIAVAWNWYSRPWIVEHWREDEWTDVKGIMGPVKDRKALHEVFVMSDVAAHVVPSGAWEDVGQVWE